MQLNSHKPAVLFLDIDGPVIDLQMYQSKPYVSHFRTHCNIDAIKNIVELCHKFDLKIVTNSMHNYHDLGNVTLKDDLIRWGVPISMFHANWRTIFPQVDYQVINSPIRGVGRLFAIEQWLKDNPGYEWICFDDRKFTDDHRLIHIQRMNGVDDQYRQQAAGVLTEIIG